MSYGTAKYKAGAVVGDWLNGLMSYEEMNGQLGKIAAEEFTGTLLADGIEVCMAEARAAYANATVWQNTDTGEVFDTKQAAIEAAAENYDYGDPTNAARFDDLPYIEIGRSAA